MTLPPVPRAPQADPEPSWLCGGSSAQGRVLGVTLRNGAQDTGFLARLWQGSIIQRVNDERTAPVLGYAAEMLHGVTFPCQARLKHHLGNFGTS